MGSEMNIGTINGLTVDQILDKMVEKKIGIYPGTSGSGEVNGKLILGENVEFDGICWTVCHCDYINKLVYLACTVIVQYCKYSKQYSTYSSSILKRVAKAFEDSMSPAALARMQNVTVEGVTSKVFAATKSQMNGGFDYFNTNERRICNGQKYWTSTNSDDNYDASSITETGVIQDASQSFNYGFRPFICLSL